MNILVTGGAGYIGSHTLIELVTAGYTPIVVDNLCNSSKESLKRVEQITDTKIQFYGLDVRDESGLDKVFEENDISAVIHFAGLKAVGESVKKPLLYYANNIDSTLVLLDVMEKHDVKKLVFSSSATVYGDPATVPITEDFPLSATNPYGQTKLMIEQILQDVSATKDDWEIVSLRYFNPIGAHKSGKIGEDPNDIPNNLMPYIAQVAVGKLEHLSVFGDDYNTIDGTGVRDYIHVVDLAKAHVVALKNGTQPNKYSFYNIGTGNGTSVLQAVKAFEQASGKNVPYKIVGRRPGDIATCYADTSKANKELGWNTTKTVADACADAWRWQSQNPDGY